MGEGLISHSFHYCMTACVCVNVLMCQSLIAPHALCMYVHGHSGVCVIMSLSHTPACHLFTQWLEKNESTLTDCECVCVCVRVCDMRPHYLQDLFYSVHFNLGFIPVSYLSVSLLRHWPGASFIKICVGLTSKDCVRRKHKKFVSTKMSWFIKQCARTSYVNFSL